MFSLKSLKSYFSVEAVAVTVLVAAAVGNESFGKFVKDKFELILVGVAGVIITKLAKYEQSLKYITKSIAQVEITNQVMATRANVMEWRSCLTTIGQWHGVSLPSAYKLWQLQLGGVPPCPASQKLGYSPVDEVRGSAMVQSDEKKSLTELPQTMLELMKLESHVSTVLEYQKWYESGAAESEGDAKWMNKLKEYVEVSKSFVADFMSNKFEYAAGDESESAVRKLIATYKAKLGEYKSEFFSHS